MKQTGSPSTRARTHLHCDATHTHGRMARDEQTRFVFALMIDMLIRLFDNNIWCYSCIVLSLYAVHCVVPVRFWVVMVKCRILYSTRVVYEIARDLGRKVCCVWPSWASKTIAIAVFDNCAYSIRTNHEHVDSSRQNLFYQTVNWFYSFVCATFDEAVAADGAYSNPHHLTTRSLLKF